MRYKVLPMVVAFLTAVVTIVAWYVQVTEKRFALVRTAQTALNDLEINRLKSELNLQLKQQIAKAPRDVTAAALDQGFKNLEEKIEGVKQQTVGLRQAINPSRPEEILTIARLTDDVNALRKSLGDLDQKLSQQNKNFQESIVRELKSSSDSTTLILVVLIPLVLNFLYTVWKDIKGAKGEKAKP